MSNITLISSDEHRDLHRLHDSYHHKKKLAGLSAAAASFLLIGALIVIFCASLCFMLPGINAMTQIVLPAIVPSLVALLLSLPCILFAFQTKRSMAPLREEIFDEMFRLLNVYLVPAKHKKERVNFILKNFFNWHIDPNSEKPNKLRKNSDWDDDYQRKLVMEFQEKLGKKESERTLKQKKIHEALTVVLNKIAYN